MRRYVDVLSEKASSPATRQDLKSLAQAQHVDDAINIQFTSGTTGLPKVTYPPPLLAAISSSAATYLD